MTRVRGVVLVALAGFAFGLPVAAQTAQGSGGALFQRYTFDTDTAASVESVSLVSLPFSGIVRFNPRLSFSVSGAWAEGRLEDPERGEFNISGLTDTQLMLTLDGRGGATSVSAVVLLPTGLETQTLNESRVAGAVASELLPFAISNWGTGGGAGVSVSTAHAVGGLGVGFSASYLVRREFAPLDDPQEETFAYRPGNTLSLAAAIDGTLGGSTKGALRLTVHRHEDDLADDANLFREGNRVELLGSLGFPIGARSIGLIYGIIQKREQGTFLSADGSLASQDLILAGGGLRKRVGTWVLQPRLEARLFRREDGVEQGYDVGAGIDAEIPVGGTLWVPSVRAHLGNLEVVEGIETGFSGLEFGLALRFGGGA
jgi:hypothetical protein